MNVKQSNVYRYLSWQFVTVLALCVVAFGVRADDRFDTGLLWKIESDGVAPSYLFGTMHSDDPRVVQLPAAVQQAFDRAGSVTLEVELDPQALLSLATALMLADGSKLESLIGPGLYRRSVQALGAQGTPEVLVAGMKPWAVAVTLMTPPNQSGEVLDQALYLQAKSSGKQVSGLESVAEQLALFDELSLDVQIALLEDTLDNLPDIPQMLAALQAAYLDRDLKRLAEINASALQDSDPQFAKDFNRKVIIDRNHRMAERMQEHLHEGDHFIAVGALHLPGEEGLLALLSGRGYRVSRVY
ncbi:MAG: TraB/GumN family protein [Thiogranum sp.]